MTEVAGCILAGGLARRMGGGDKGLRHLAGRPVLNHVIDRLQLQLTKICLNANGDPARFASYNLPVVADSIDGFAGPLAGVLAGLDWAAQNNFEKIITIAIDTPFFPDNLAARLLDVATKNNTDLACAASAGRHHPVIGLWPVRLVEDLRHALTNEGLHKVDIWTAQHNCAVVEFSHLPYDPFFNVNRPDDMNEAERIYEEYHI